MKTHIVLGVINTLIVLTCVFNDSIKDAIKDSVIGGVCLAFFLICNVAIVFKIELNRINKQIKQGGLCYLASLERYRKYLEQTRATPNSHEAVLTSNPRSSNGDV